MVAVCRGFGCVQERDFCLVAGCLSGWGAILAAVTHPCYSQTHTHTHTTNKHTTQDGSDLVRWAAHCSLGTILRFHGAQHQPWSYDQTTEDNIRTYLKMRYALLPSLIAAGHQASETGFPLVARLDLFYPTYTEAASNEQCVFLHPLRVCVCIACVCCCFSYQTDRHSQHLTPIIVVHLVLLPVRLAGRHHRYLHLNNTLVAPVASTAWIPNGEWQNAWDGSNVTGPTTVQIDAKWTQQMPMWHRVGSMMVTSSDRSALRVDDQDWSELTLEAFVPRQTDVTYVTRDGKNHEPYMRSRRQETMRACTAANQTPKAESDRTPDAAHAHRHTRKKQRKATHKYKLCLHLIVT